MGEFLFVVGIILVLVLFVGIEAKVARDNRKATKICQHCGSTIPFNATKCPYCHEDPGIDFRAEGKGLFRHPVLRFWIVLLAVALLIVIILNLIGH